jgi:adenylate kinase
MSMRALMIAPPGAGKGTQGALIATHFDIPHIATGELLRDHVARRTADVALHLQADDAELLRRLLARAALEHRSDDTADIIAQRLALYHEVTSPIVSWYRERGILVSVDAMRSEHEVGREILAALEAMRPFLDQGPRRHGCPST